RMNTYLEYARRGRTAWWRYLLTMALALVIAGGLVFGVTLALVFTNVISVDAVSQLEKPTHPVVFFLSNGVLFADVVLGLAVAMWLLQRKSFADVVGQWRGSRFAAGLGVWTV